MTSEEGSTWIVEDDVPLPKRSGYEKLPKDTSQKLLELDVGGALFLPVKDKDHAKKRAASIRSHTRRVTEENPDYKFRVYVDIRDDSVGVRVWRDRVDEDNEQSQPTGSSSPSSDERRLHEREEQ